jgi:hypothetical protein
MAAARNPTRLSRDRVKTRLGGRIGKRELFVGVPAQAIEKLTLSATNSVHAQLPPSFHTVSSEPGTDGRS